MLTVKTYHDELVVEDSEGGVWSPSDEAEAEVQASARPEETILRICREAPMRGTWQT